MAAPARLWQIRRIYLDRIGSPAARFLNVWLEFTSKAGVPLDTILWMRNGGGKSTLIALVCALIRPDRRDFLATATTGRHLEDCVLGADTAHVVVEWMDPDGRRLVTGAVYEWTDRSQPADPNSAHDRLQQRWYAFTPIGVDAEIEHLPFTGEGGRPTDLKDFAKAVENLPADSEPAVTDTQDRWAGVLQDRGLDPELFTAILKINASEGGIEHHFKFKTADDFVQYLLSLVSNPASPAKIAKILARTRDRLARQPRLQAELDFCEEAIHRLRDLVDARDAFAEAQETQYAQQQTAAALAASLRAAADLAGERAGQHESQAGEHRRAQAEATGQVAAFDALAREYQWWAAYRRDAEAKNVQQTADEGLTAAAVHDRAWTLVPTLVEQAEASQRLAVLREQQRQAEAGAEPARRARARAAAVLRVALQRAAEELTAQAATLTGQAATARTEQATARAQADALRERLGGLGARNDTLTTQLDAFNQAVAVAAAAGHLDSLDDLPTAHAASERADADAARQIDTVLPAAEAQLAVDREEYETQRSMLGQQREAALRAKAGIDNERNPLLAEIGALQADSRLAALAQADVVDPIGEYHTLTGTLAEEIIAADRQRIELAVADADDRRAVEALASPRGLLPAALDLARAADVLAHHRPPIPATTGWHYLADAVPPARWAHAIATAAHLVGGLLVYDPADLDVAHDALEQAELYPTSAVQVATTADLQRAVESPPTGGPGFVVPPAPAMFDRAASAREAERREVASRERSGRLQDLADARDADLRLQARLHALADRCPPGHLEHLDAESARVAKEITDLERRTGDLAAVRTELDQRGRTLQAQREHHARQRRQLGITLNVLGDLLRRAPDAQQMRTELADLPALRATLQKDLLEAERIETERAETATDASSAADRKGNAARDHQTRRDELARIADDTIAVVTEPLPTLAAAQSRYLAADQAYTSQTSESALEATITEVNARLTALDETVTASDPDVLAAATTLAATAEAADPAAVRRASADAQRRHHEAQRAKALADNEANTATQHLTECTLTRPATTDLMTPVVEPATVDEAHRRFQAATVELTRCNDAHQQAGEHASNLDAQAASERQRAEELTQYASELDDSIGEAAAETGSDAAAFDGDAAAAREKARLARRGLAAAERTSADAGRALVEQGHRIARWAADERFGLVAAEVRDRFRTEHAADDLAPQAEALTEQLTLYRQSLARELDAINKDKHVVVTAVCGDVRDALRTLQRAQTHALLPPGIGEHLTNRRFLDVGPRSNVDTSDAVLRSRVERLIDKLVDRKEAIPDGVTLVWEATSAAVGRGNFAARVLKPSTALTEERQPVELMSKWSGGEKVTISLLLFCMLARLRAANRGGDVPGLGVLPMDNPLGTANYVAFLDLQRRVAAANGIQLVFLSGLGDMRAVGRFPNIVRMRNTHNNARSYARVAEREINDDHLGGVITTARLTLPVQEHLL